SCRYLPRFLLSSISVILVIPLPPSPSSFILSLHDALPISSLAVINRDQSRLIYGCSKRNWAVTLLSIAHDCQIAPIRPSPNALRSEEHTSELQSRFDLVCRLLLEKKKTRVSIGLQHGPHCQ